MGNGNVTCGKGGLCKDDWSRVKKAITMNDFYVSRHQASYSNEGRFPTVLPSKPDLPYFDVKKRRTQDRAWWNV